MDINGKLLRLLTLSILLAANVILTVFLENPLVHLPHFLLLFSLFSGPMIAFYLLVLINSFFAVEGRINFVSGLMIALSIGFISFWLAKIYSQDYYRNLYLVFIFQNILVGAISFLATSLYRIIALIKGAMGTIMKVISILWSPFVLFWSTFLILCFARTIQICDAGGMAAAGMFTFFELSIIVTYLFLSRSRKFGA